MERKKLTHTIILTHSVCHIDTLTYIFHNLMKDLKSGREDEFSLTFYKQTYRNIIYYPEK